jgi:hypothetical protein
MDLTPTYLFMIILACIWFLCNYYLGVDAYGSYVTTI